MPLKLRTGPTCAMSSTMVEVFPVPGGPKMTYGVRRSRRNAHCTAVVCS
jgi:hypothetical protein